MACRPNKLLISASFLDLYFFHSCLPQTPIYPFMGYNPQIHRTLSLTTLSCLRDFFVVTVVTGCFQHFYSLPCFIVQWFKENNRFSYPIIIVGSIQDKCFIYWSSFLSILHLNKIYFPWSSPKQNRVPALIPIGIMIFIVQMLDTMFETICTPSYTRLTYYMN